MGEVSKSVWPPSGGIWAARVLGRFEVSSLENPLPRFRSRTAFSLLGYMLLQDGSEVPNYRLCTTFWPESDGDRQAQNLRRAVADLREVLEHGMVRGSVVKTRDEAVALNADHIASDLDAFICLASDGLKSLDEPSLKEAVELYFGPVLAPLDGDWVLPHRMEAEELYAQCVAQLAEVFVSRQQHREALKLGRTAVIAAPHREDVHVALIRAYKAAGLESEALRQFEELERLLDEFWGEQPSEKARAALDQRSVTVAQPMTSSPTLRSSARSPSGGALPIDSPHYVVRRADSEVEAALSAGESTILLHGPRQVGKTSLIARSLDFARRHGSRALLTDFQALGEKQLAVDENFYKSLSLNLASQLGQRLDIDARWNQWLGPNLNLDSIMDDFLRSQPGSVCWAIDEADRLFEKPYSDDFFGLLRSWHNRRAFDPTGPWSKLSIVISYALDAHLFIGDPSQSPFNVGIRVVLQDFSIEEIERLNELCGSPLTGGECARLRETTRGQPWLTRQALELISSGTATLDSLLKDAAHPNGPYGDHLARLLRSATHDPDTLSEVKKGLLGSWSPNARICERLVASGVLVRAQNGYAFRAPLYGDFLAAALKASS